MPQVAVRARPRDRRAGSLRRGPRRWHRRRQRGDTGGGGQGSL